MQHPPVANDDHFGIVATQGAMLNLTGSWFGVLANDYDPDGDPISIVSTGSPEHGSVSAGSSPGSLCYTPEEGFVGADSFTYSITDGMGGNASATVFVTVAENSPQVNLTIDSNNDGSLSSTDDEIEDHEGDDEHPGKVVVVSNTDTDDDGILDWVDGFDWADGVSADNNSPGSSFTPLRLSLPFAFDRDSLSIEFVYNDSDPAQYRTHNFGNRWERPTDGALRLWRKDGSQPRNPSGIDDDGDFIAANVSYTAAELGLEGTTATFYLEAVNPSQAIADHLIKVRVTGGGLSSGQVLEDKVRVTTTMVQIMAPSGEEGDQTTEVYNFSATRLPQYDAATGEPMFNSSRQLYTINVFDPRTLDHITLAGQNIPLIEADSLSYTTEPFIVIRQAEASLIAPDDVVAFKTEIDDSGAYLGDVVTFSQRPSEVIGDLRVITVADGTRPVIQYVWFEQEGKSIVFSELAEGADKTIADLVNRAMTELGPDWTATNPTDSGSYGKAVHAKVKQSMDAAWKWLGFGEAARWKTGMLVDWRDGRISQLSGATQGVGDLTEIDAIYLKPGYEPEVGRPLDKTKVIIYEIKTSANGNIKPEQLRRLKAIQGGEVRQIWSELKWQQSTNTLVKNPKYAKALGVARNLSTNAKISLAATGGIMLLLSGADQALANFEAEALTLNDYQVSNKSADQIALQEAKILAVFKDLVDGCSGGIVDEYSSVTLLHHIYKRVIPAFIQADNQGP